MRDADNIRQCRLRHTFGRGVTTLVGFALLVAAFTLLSGPMGLPTACLAAAIAFALVVGRSFLVSSVGAGIDAEENAISSMADEVQATLGAGR